MIVKVREWDAGVRAEGEVTARYARAYQTPATYY